MNCPLCGLSLRHNGPTMHSIWMEAESNEEIAMVVHVSCAWDAIRDALSSRDKEWVGWEPMDQVSPHEIEHEWLSTLMREGKAP